jgi:phosphopantothenoylcysteine decarboxylase/phosphopantothenate--cysteine ligase
VFGQADNEVTVLAADGGAGPLLSGRKDAVAAGIWDAVSAALAVSD